MASLAHVLFEQYLKERADAPPAKKGVGRAAAEGPGDTVSEPDRDALVEVLRRSLPRRRRGWVGGYRSGPGLDLNRIMRAAATGRDGDRIWVRRIAERPALAAMLLVDLSGSMRGHKIDAAIAATRAVSGALAEIRGVSWCVLGFQDEIIPFVDFDERADDTVLSRIDAMRREVAGTREGGNNRPSYNDDGPCLLEAAAVLATRRERNRLLMVISDGKPEGRRSSRADLHAAIATVQAIPNMTLVGLGLGPGTDHVTEYYPISQADVVPADLAAAVGRLLAASLEMTS